MHKPPFLYAQFFMFQKNNRLLFLFYFLSLYSKQPNKIIKTGALKRTYQVDIYKKIKIKFRNRCCFMTWKQTTLPWKGTFPFCVLQHKLLFNFWVKKNLNYEHPPSKNPANAKRLRKIKNMPLRRKTTKFHQTCKNKPLASPKSSFLKIPLLLQKTLYCD